MTIVTYMEERVVLDPGGCWLWTMSRTNDGYGNAVVNGKPMGAHRLAHEVFIGPIPPDHDVHHICGTRACVNPEHLEAQSSARHAGHSHRDITHCPHGHAYVGENVRITRAGWRQCRTCDRERARRRRAR